MKKLLSQIISCILGIWLASLFIVGVTIRVLPDSNFFGFALQSNWQVIVLLGIILGILNAFVKPVLKIITLPLRVLTLGLFGIIINIALVWILDLIFKEIAIPWFLPLLWTTLIIFALNLLISKILLKDK